jgi:hypothetical protein
MDGDNWVCCYLQVLIGSRMPRGYRSCERDKPTVAPVVQLDEELVDQRSRQIAYKLNIEAKGSYVFRLTQLEPRIPKGSRLVEIIDTSMAEIDTRRKELIEELNAITEKISWAHSEVFRQEIVKQQREVLRQALSFSGILGIYANMIWGLVSKNKTWENRIEAGLRKVSFKIHSVHDAQKAYDLWVKQLNENDDIPKLFLAKIDQLQQIELKVGKGEDAGLADVNSSSPFSATYVIEFKRGFLEARKYQIGFDIEYVETDSAKGPAARQPRTTNTARTVEISPNPLVLSIVAMISALLGTTAKILISTDMKLWQIGTVLDSAQMLVGPIVALIFFNIYEHTSLNRSVPLKVNWRSALFIGALCGLAHERILEALKALIGV